jgi:hypothetical protein
MIRLFRGSGSDEIELGRKALTDEEWASARTFAVRLLRSRSLDSAASHLERLPFEVFDGTNYFSDEFYVLLCRLPLEQYVVVAELARSAEERRSFAAIASAVSEVGGPPIRFVAAEIDRRPGTVPVSPPTTAITSAAVEHALADAEALIMTRGASSAVDRVHTALHAYLGAACQDAGIGVVADLSITQLFRSIRDRHPAMLDAGPRADDVERVARAMATIVDALNAVRNRASRAHPNDEVLDEPEAMLVINSVRTLLHYLDAKLRRQGPH